MKIRYIGIFSVLFVIFPMLWANPAQAEKHALLIGIDDYHGSGLGSLMGAVNDIHLVRDVLINRFGFLKNNIQVLTDRDASHSGVKRAFEELAGKVGAGDVVYIHYSGHGSYTKDLNGDEAQYGGKDQTWVTWGSRSHGNDQEMDNHDVLDDELGEWLLPLVETAKQVVLVSDSCHSASVTRDADGPRVRAAPTDERFHPLGKREYRKLGQKAGIRIGSARDTQSAGERIGKDGFSSGLFTWHWASVLEEAKPGQSWNELFHKVEARVRATPQGHAQEPQITGKSHTAVFGGEFLESPPLVPVLGKNPDGLVYLDAGGLVGVTKGSVYRPHDAPREKQDVRITVEKVFTFKSLGRAEGGMIEAGDLLEEVEHHWPHKPVQIRVAADLPSDAGLVSMLREAVSRIPGYRLTETQAEAQMVLRILRPGKQVSLVNGDGLRELPPSKSTASPEVWVLTPTDDLYHPDLRYSLREPNTKALSILREDLGRIAHAREIRRLAERGRTLPPKLSFLHLRRQDCGLSEAGCREIHGERYLQQAPAPAAVFKGKSLVSGDIVSFVIDNPSPSEYWVYLVNIAPDAGVEVIFPNSEDNAETALVRPGPRDLSQSHALLLDKTGQETVQMIVSRKPIRIDLLARSGFLGGVDAMANAKGATTTTLQFDNDLNSLERLLRRAADGTRAGISLRNDTWGAGNYVFQVVSKEGGMTEKGTLTRGGADRGAVSVIVR
uniref:Caspase domain-containing protein n=1 Tax=Candidatus Kentrum sp. DK TaxID=2126562 RepID=A0A450SPW4_9GAMM|nr:MAG: Caspase domain-containing protein [Candidatus Kentron sp. DK]